jgi:DNA end-binding protein Ku
LSLVSIPVELHSAIQSGAHISFRQIHKPSGKPVRYEKVVAGLGPVKTDDIVKGYEYGKDNYVLIAPEEVEAIRLESKKTFELVQFVGACEISPLYFDTPYFLVPADELAEDAYRVVRDALRRSERIGLGQITLRGREYLATVKPCGDGLLLETLRYADEIRKAEPLFAGIEDEAVDADLLDVATALIERKSAPFDAGAYQDHYTEALRSLVDAKLHNRQTARVNVEESDTARPSGDNVIDLMAVLKKSLAASKGSAARGGKESNGDGATSANGNGAAAKSKGAAKSTGGSGKRGGKAAASKAPANKTASGKAGADKTTARAKAAGGRRKAG